MSEQSKNLSDPNFAAENPDSEMQGAAAFPPDFLVVNLAAQASSPPPEGRPEDADPGLLQQAIVEACGHQPLHPPQPSPLPPAPIQVVQKAHELVWYVLVKGQRKMVLWFPDIVREVIGNYKKWCRSILRRTNAILTRVFGLQLRLISFQTLEFVLVKARSPQELARVGLNNRMPMTGLLLMILGLIYVKGRGVRESEVWNVLRILGLKPWNKHSTFGDVRKIITEEFVQMNYLKYQRVPHVEPPEYQFLWGSRAHREITKMQILEFLARIFKRSPQAWPSRYREALEQSRALREANLAAQARRRRSNVSKD